MRVVYLTTEFPWPPTRGGPVRTLSQLRLLASLPEVEGVTLLSTSQHAVGEGQLRGLAAALPGVTALPPVVHPTHLWDSPRHVPRVVLLRALRGVPYLAAKWDSPALRRVLRRELRAAPPDVVYVDHLGMARYLPEIEVVRPRCRVVLDQHNVESDFFAQFAAARAGVARRLAHAECRAALRFERRALTAVDAVVAISPDDAARLATIAHVRAHVVAVVVAAATTPRPHPGRPHFCYVGNLRWAPNAAGLDWLCRDVWPRLRARVPAATLEIAGVGLGDAARRRPRGPPRWQGPGITVTGFLEDLEPLYTRSVGMLAPVQSGSGIRIKVLEALRAGMPVVTTADGADGTQLRDGIDALVASDPDGFAERAARVAGDEALRDRLRRAGHEYLTRHHSAAAAAAAMRAVLGLA